MIDTLNSMLMTICDYLGGESNTGTIDKKGKHGNDTYSDCITHPTATGHEQACQPIVPCSEYDSV